MTRQLTLNRSLFVISVVCGVLFARSGVAQVSENERVHAAIRGGSVKIAVADASPSVPAGTIRVTVVNASGQPVQGASVDVGVMKQGGDRDKKLKTTGPDGIVSFEGLPTGSSQAYRVNAPYEGAKYSSNPFRLPPDRGYEVKITQLPVTTDGRFLLQYLSRNYLELKDGRIRVVQQAQLANLGDTTYKFPEDGFEVEFPEGAKAFQTQAVMTDQRIVESDKGARILGSLPPGRVSLMWAFDMPLDGEEFNVTLPVPFKTYRFSIEADGPPGSQLEVEGFPDSVVHEENGKRFLVTQKQLESDEPQVKTLKIKLSGLPGPGPTRWIALAIAFAFAVVGVFFSTRKQGEAGASAGTAADLDARRQGLLREVTALHAERVSGEVGPKFYERRRREITVELAEVLRALDAQPKG